MVSARGDALPPLRATSLVRPSDLQEFGAWSRRSIPDVSRVAEHVWSIPVPAPGLPIRYTLCYAVRRAKSWVVVDPGLSSPQGWDALVEGLSRAGATMTSVRGIVGTHAHPDHVGQVGRLQELTGAWFALGDGEVIPVRDGADAAARDDALLRAWGVPDGLRDALNTYRSPEAIASVVPPVDIFLQDGDVLPDVGLITVSTPGHTPGHVCFIDERSDAVFTGDHVLPRISPHVSVWTDGLTDPLKRYRASLRHLLSRPASLVLPGHEYRFEGLSQRVEELDHALIRRNAEVAAVAHESEATDVWGLAPLIRWSRGWDSLHGLTRRLALSECASHVEYANGVNAMTGRIATRPRSEAGQRDALLSRDGS
ncbi:MBL fold metallo-hydrolase [Microbacterium sp. CPCC 204701]|uniref:MBL fold metallo-hydrolase n=1 Tax=Microbacterium sp. CPCC 204701 TaxID=2493084 RepID=UPI000FDB85D7|nr:MBL fold metallo-hydrolase [Microbacterium sp. CPCC 204701]